MKVTYRTRKLTRQCEDPRIAKKDFGPQIGNTLTRRVGEFLAATSLWDIKNIPAPRLHRLQGNRAGEYAVDLVHPFRLVFTPLVHAKTDLHALQKITAIRIERVEDYHGKQRRY